MASTYSSLKIELIGTGDQAGTWGTTTNTNLGTAIEEAITGSANVTFASSNAALSLTDTNATQTARNLRLNLTGTLSNVQYLFVPAIEKQYVINNTLSNSVVIANGSNSGATGTTFTLPTGRTSIIFNDGTNINDVVTFVSSLQLNTYTEGVLVIGNTGNAVTMNIANGTVLTATLNANCTWTMPTTVAGKSFILLLKQGSNGSYTSSFTNVKWVNNLAPTITASNTAMDILTFISDGTNWYGNYAQGFRP
jgi:hypothetical protein